MLNILVGLLLLVPSLAAGQVSMRCDQAPNLVCATAADDVAGPLTFAGTGPLVFEGATPDAFEIFFLFADPVSDKTILFPDLSGTVCLDTGSGCGTGGSGTSVILDLADDGSNESTAITEIATTGDTNTIFTEPSADKLLITVSDPWPTTDAFALNPTDCAANQYAHTIAANGNLTCTAVTSAQLSGTCTDNQVLGGNVGATGFECDTISWVAGDDGAGTTNVAVGETGDTLELNGGGGSLAGVDTICAADVCTFNFDTTEVSGRTWGSGVGFTWTFDTAAATDPAIVFTGGNIVLSGGTGAQVVVAPLVTGNVFLDFDDLDTVGTDRDGSVTVNCVDTTTDDCSFKIGARLNDTNDVSILNAVAKAEGDNDITLGNTATDGTDTITYATNGEVASAHVFQGGDIVIQTQNDLVLNDTDNSNFISHRAVTALAGNAVYEWSDQQSACTATEVITVSASSGGVVTLACSPSSGGASNSFVTWVTPAGSNPDADSSTDTITFTDGIGLLVTGTGGAADAIDFSFDYTNTLAGDPALAVDACVFSTDGTGGGIICEGSITAGEATVEGLLVWNPSTSDRTLTLPDATDTLVARATTDTLTNKTINGASNTLTVIAGQYAAASIDGDDINSNLAGPGLTLNTATTPDSLEVVTGIGIQISSNLVSFRYADILTGDPDFNAEECVFTIDGPGGGGFLCEGTVGANANEQLYLFPAVDGANTTKFIAVDTTEVQEVDGDGLLISTGTLAVDLLTANDGTGAIASDSGMEFGGASSDELALLQGCANGEILKWDDAATDWECATDTGAGGGDSIQVNAVAVTDANFNDTTPAAPANGFNTHWQRSGTGPDSVSTHLLTTDVGTTTWGGGAPITWSFNTGAGATDDAQITFGTGTITFTPGFRQTVFSTTATGGDDSVEFRFDDPDETLATNDARIEVNCPETGADPNVNCDIDFSVINAFQNYVFLQVNSDTANNEGDVVLGSASAFAGTTNIFANRTILIQADEAVTIGSTGASPVTLVSSGGTALDFDNATGTGTDNVQIASTCTNATNCGFEFFVDMAGVSTKVIDWVETGTGFNTPIFGEINTTTSFDFRGVDALEYRFFTLATGTSNTAAQLLTDCADANNCTVRLEHRVGATSNVDILNASTSAGVVTTFLGAASTGSITLVTNGTGDTEVELPDESINLDELTDAGSTPDTNECLKVAATTTQVKYENCITNSGTLFNLAGDTGSEPIAGGDSLFILGSSAADQDGIDVDVEVTDIARVKFDATEVDTRTWGAGSGWTWTFNAGATDPTIAFASNAITIDTGDDSSDLNINDNIEILTTSHTFTATAPIIHVNNGNTLTLNASIAPVVLRLTGTIVFNEAPPSFGAGNVFHLASTVRQQTGETTSFTNSGPFRAFTGGPTFEPDGGTFNAPYQSFFHNVIYQTNASETLTAGSGGRVEGFVSQGAIDEEGGGTLDIDHWIGYHFSGPVVVGGSEGTDTNIDIMSAIYIRDMGIAAVGPTIDGALREPAAVMYTMWTEGAANHMMHAGDVAIGVLATGTEVPEANLEISSRDDEFPFNVVDATEDAGTQNGRIMKFITHLEVTGATTSTATLLTTDAQEYGIVRFWCVCDCTASTGGCNTTTDQAHYGTVSRFDNDSGTLGFTGATADVTTSEFNASVDCSLVASGQDLQMSVTSIASATIDCNGYTELFMMDGS